MLEFAPARTRPLLALLQRLPADAVALGLRFVVFGDAAGPKALIRFHSAAQITRLLVLGGPAAHAVAIGVLAR